MGKAVILQNLGEGQYKVRYLYQQRGIEQQAALLEVQKAQLQETIEATEAELEEAEAALPGYDTELNSLLNQIKDASTDPNYQGPSIVELQKRVTEILQVINQATQGVVRLEATLAALEARLAGIDLALDRLAKVKTEEELTLWIADYTTELEPHATTNFAAVLEVPGEKGESPHMVLAPGKEKHPDHKLDKHGEVVPALAMSKEALFYNWAMLAAWQKFAPTYRFAKILGIDYNQNRAELELVSPNRSSVNRIEVTPTDMKSDQAASLSSVPFDYMDCNSDAFLPGDITLVQYRDNRPDDPVIIGFKDNPRPCTRVRFMTPHGGIVRKGDSWQFSANTELQYGVLDWKGEQKGSHVPIISWDGEPTRLWTTVSSMSSNIYYKGSLFATLLDNEKVLGAALTKYDEEATSPDNLIVVSLKHNSSGQAENISVYRRPLTGEDSDTWLPIGSISLPSDAGFLTDPGVWCPCLFNRTGDRAMLILCRVRFNGLGSADLRTYLYEITITPNAAATEMVLGTLDTYSDFQLQAVIPNVLYRQDWNGASYVQADYDEEGNRVIATMEGATHIDWPVLESIEVEPGVFINSGVALFTTDWRLKIDGQEVITLQRGLEVDPENNPGTHGIVYGAFSEEAGGTGELPSNWDVTTSMLLHLDLRSTNKRWIVAEMHCRGENAFEGHVPWGVGAYYLQGVSRSLIVRAETGVLQEIAEAEFIMAGTGSFLPMTTIRGPLTFGLFHQASEVGDSYYESTKEGTTEEWGSIAHDNFDRICLSFKSLEWCDSWDTPTGPGTPFQTIVETYVRPSGTADTSPGISFINHITEGELPSLTGQEENGPIGIGN